MMFSDLIPLALASSALFVGSSLATTAPTPTATKCNHDNCLRALNPTGRVGRTAVVADAATFCQTFTATPSLSSYPVYATSACGFDGSRYSSACKCAFPTTVTPGPGPTNTPGFCDPGNAVKNGDFEKGNISPPQDWQYALDGYKGELYAASQNGQIAYKGTHSAAFRAGADSYFNGSFATTSLFQDVPIFQGENSRLEFHYRFDSYFGNAKGGRFIVKIDNREYQNTRRDSVAVDEWIPAVYTFTPRAGATARIEFIVRADQGDSVFVGLDTVFVPAKSGDVNPCP
ncbi:MAG: hypothetical protein M1814_004934 [Vezdaea aestivalis]|nr:MAG: hypothetical protein M1814_004934 [Vezdaea aestivalis]